MGVRTEGAEERYITLHPPRKKRFSKKDSQILVDKHIQQQQQQQQGKEKEGGFTVDKLWMNHSSFTILL